MSPALDYRILPVNPIAALYDPFKVLITSRRNMLSTPIGFNLTFSKQYACCVYISKPPIGHLLIRL